MRMTQVTARVRTQRQSAQEFFVRRIINLCQDYGSIVYTTCKFKSVRSLLVRISPKGENNNTGIYPDT